MKQPSLGSLLLVRFIHPRFGHRDHVETRKSAQVRVNEWKTARAWPQTECKDSVN